MKNVSENFKKPSKAKHPFTIRQVRRMYRSGFADTRSGRHRKLCLMFQNGGILRQNAARRLRIFYRVRRGGDIVYDETRSSVWVDRSRRRPAISGKVSADKNVNARKQREFHIPHRIYKLGIKPVEMLENYLRQERPPSGGYLLAAPKGREGFYDTAYTGMTKAYKQAYQHSHPDATDSARFGSGSARKAMSQWLWSDGWAKRIISDAGGWFMKKSAVDLYFKTEPDKILRAIRNVGKKSKGRKNRR